ncbi:MAG: HlyU family transcriptional regulator [Pseudomonadota bacterium]
MILGKLFGGLFRGGSDQAGGDEEGEAVEYNGYMIVPLMRRDGGQFMTAGIIRKTINGEPKEEQFIRADRHSSPDDARQLSIAKGRQIIDEQGDSLFRG